MKRLAWFLLKIVETGIFLGMLIGLVWVFNTFYEWILRMEYGWLLPVSIILGSGFLVTFGLFGEANWRFVDKLFKGR